MSIAFIHATAMVIFKLQNHEKQERNCFMPQVGTWTALWLFYHK